MQQGECYKAQSVPLHYAPSLRSDEFYHSVTLWPHSECIKHPKTPKLLELQFFCLGPLSCIWLLHCLSARLRIQQYLKILDSGVIARNNVTHHVILTHRLDDGHHKLIVRLVEIGTV